MSIDVDGVLAGATTEELAALVCGADSWSTAAIERLGVPAVRLADGPHGLRVTTDVGIGGAQPATCFPTAAGLGSTWNPGLLRRVGEALGREALALGVDVILGPGVNIKRSPLCGRNFEYFSEDPLLTGALASGLIYGIQSAGVGACLKHFAANNQETDRMRVDARVTERALREIYLPAFERAVSSVQPWLVMSSYNRVNGELASQNAWLLTDVLRGDWDFQGAVVSDWGAVYDRAAALVAGLDLEMPHEPGNSDTALVAAVESGELSREVLMLGAERVLYLAYRAQEALRPADPRVGHHDLAREAAVESMVLLANDPPAGSDRPILPLAPDATVALVGEFARTPRFQGGGSSKVNPVRVDRLAETLAAKRQVTFAPGFLLDGRPDDGLLAEAVAAARAADVVVACLGLPDDWETEGRDRTHLRLPENQLALLAAVAEANPRVVVVLSNGAAVEVAGWAGQACALLECWLGGEAGASALADVLCGDAEPSGRLAETIAVRLSDHPSALMFPGEAGRVVYGEDVFVGYRGFDAADRAVSYPFGFGLGYTTVAWQRLDVDSQGSVAAGTFRARASVTVRNTGERAGAAVVQVYVGDPEASVARPPRELKAFSKVVLQPGESRRVSLPLDARAFSYWSERAGRWVVEGGEFTVEAGPNSRDLPLRATLTIAAPPVTPPLDAESTITEWVAHPDALAALQQRTRQRTGAEYALDEELATVIGDAPLRRFALFPGIGWSVDDVDAVLAEYGVRAEA